MDVREFSPAMVSDGLLAGRTLRDAAVHVRHEQSQLSSPSQQDGVGSSEDLLATERLV
jgi:hypothetical protein